MKNIWVDPPSGWKYGFPKIATEKDQNNINEWLIANGYPRTLIDELGEQFFIRCWEENEKQN